MIYMEEAAAGFVRGLSPIGAAVSVFFAVNTNILNV